MKFKVLIAIILLVFILQFASASFNVSLSDQGTDIKYKLNGSVVRTGNLEVTVYDALTDGNLIYNETFIGKIHNGSWNVMLGENYSNPLSLEFGKIYYRDYKINNEDIDFVNITGETLERQFFYSPLGNIGGEDISSSANLSIANLTVSGNVSASTGFFTWLGDLVNRVTTLFVQNINFNGTINGTGNITTTGYGQFAWVDALAQDTSPGTPPLYTLRMYADYDATSGFSIYKYKDDTGMVRRYGDNVFIAKNTGASTIPAMSAVYSCGSSGPGAYPLVCLAKADSLSTMPSIGITIEAIEVGTFGRVMAVGVLENVDTNLWTSNAPLYVSETEAGNLTTIKPISPNLTQEVGTVLVKSATLGKIQLVARSLTGNEFGTVQNMFVIGDGTTGVKNLTFNGDIDTFIYAKEGKLGIGTIGLGTPSQTLDVRGQGNFSGTIFINNVTDISLLNETLLALSINTTNNIGLLYNSTALLFSQLVNSTANTQSLLAGTNISQYAFNQTLQTFNAFNSSWDNRYLIAMLSGNISSVNTTANIQNLLNETGIYNKITNTTGGWTLNLSVLYVNGTQVTGSGGVPANAIMAFNQETCPTGWVLADGTGGTPDLRGIFVRGSGTNSILKYLNDSFGYISATYGVYANDSYLMHNHSVYGGFGAEGAGTWRVIEEAVNGLSTGADLTSQVGIALPGAASDISRRGEETSPAYYATIYCVKTGEDSNVSNSIWGTLGNDVILQNTSMNLAINNTNFFLNTTSGYVGIGTITPTQLLEIQMNSAGLNQKSPLVIRSLNTAGNGAQPALRFISSDDSYNASIYFGAGSGNLAFATRDITRIHINGSNGNVGIGTESPRANLEITSGGVAGETNLLLSGVDNEAVSYPINITDENGNPMFIIKSSGDGSINLKIGIGTSSPEAPFHINADGNQVKIENTAAIGGTLIQSDYFTIASGVASTIYTFDTRSSGVVYVNAVDASAGAGSTYQAVVYWSYSNDNLATSITENVGAADAGLAIVGTDLQITSAVAAFTEVATTVIGNKR